MLGDGRYAEVVKDQNKHENVIDAERVLDQIAGQKIQAAIFALPLPDQRTKGEREYHPNRAAQSGSAHAQRASAPLETDQIQCKSDEDADMKRDPKPDARMYGHGA